MQKRRSIKNQAGQTIVELLIATAVVATVLTAVAAGLTYTVKNAAEARYRQTATLKAQEVIEVFRRERNNLGWESFNESVIDGATYCFNDLPSNQAAFLLWLDQPESPGTDCLPGVAESGTEFSRIVQVAVPSANQVTVEVSVNWYDNENQRNVVIRQEFQSYSVN
ncbi:MAG: prepilin-type N-terminal cleavage/methylation domain-containing protein [bacterium]|nr:prepilin-type N-terminal cleavage/methylation domain-containing protein [bacterium]